MGQLLVIFWTALKLGLVSFGGPSAHLAYFERVYVKEKKWLTAVEYADLVSLSQFLPGPASSQVGMGIGLKKGGILGSIVAFLGFTLPSVIVLMVFAYIHAKGNWSLVWLHGLKLVAVAIVAHAILDMSKKIWHSKMAIILTVVATAVLLSWQTTYSTIIVLLIAALAGQLFLRQQQQALLVENVISKRIAAGFLIAFGVLLIALPLIAKLWPTTWLVMFEKFYNPKDSPLWSLQNIIVTPHTGGAAKGAMRAMAETAARHIISVLDGDGPDARSVANPAFQSAAPAAR